MTPSRSINIVGMDPSLRNWGIVRARYNLDTRKLDNIALECIRISPPKGKQIRQNSKDIQSAVQLYEYAYHAAQHAHAVFVEVPVGSQSARSMASYGICVGVLGALRANGIPIYEMTPSEVKLAGAGTVTASKREMIAWAMNQHPEANWPIHNTKGVTKVTESIAEHQADALAAIYAGLGSNQFKQMASLLMPFTNGENFADPVETS